MSTPPDPNWWYRLPQDPDYYKFSACVQTKENVRFWDDADTFHQHGDAICSVDCLYKHKNSILPLMYPIANLQMTVVQTCADYIHPRGRGGPPPPPPIVTCQDALFQVAQALSTGGPINEQCLNLSFDPYGPVNFVQVDNFVVRSKIYDITWRIPEVVPDFLIPTDRYDPTTPVQGSPAGTTLYDLNFADPWIRQWDYEVSIFGPTVNSVRNVVEGCMQALGPTSIQLAQNVIDYCRSVYHNTLGTSLVGPLIPLPVEPSDHDKIASMWRGCQYVYDIAEDRGCPVIDDLCKNPAFKGGRWKHQLAVLSDKERVLALPNHLCQAFSATVPPTPPMPSGVPWVTPKNPPAVWPPAPNSGLYLAGIGYNQIIQTIEPQSGPGYVYRSCALQTYTASHTNCCANDFADGEGALLFQPTITQPPFAPLPNSVRIPVFGYDYATQGNDNVPWYPNCFDVEGVPCDPAYRDITGDACAPLMLGHCVGTEAVPADAAAESWSLNASGSGECTKWLGRLLYGYKGQWIQFVSAVINNEILRERTATNLSTPILLGLAAYMHRILPIKALADKDTIPLSDLQLNFEKVMFTLYNSYNLNLYDNGSVVTQCGAYTIEDVTKNPLLRRWCGCMLSPSSYGYTYPGISIECTPTCNSSDVLQYGEPCVGNFCILDNITVQLIDSTGGNLSLSQVCQSCGQNYSNDTQQVRQTCTCAIGNVDIDLLNATMGNLNIKEVCGQAGNGGKGSATSDQPVAERVGSALQEVTRTFPFAIVTLLVAMGVLALILYLLSRGTKNGVAHLWARVLGIGLLIVGIVILAFITWYVIAETIWE